MIGLYIFLVILALVVAIFCAIFTYIKLKGIPEKLDNANIDDRKRTIYLHEWQPIFVIAWLNIITTGVVQLVIKIDKPYFTIAQGVCLVLSVAPALLAFLFYRKIDAKHQIDPSRKRLLPLTFDKLYFQAFLNAYALFMSLYLTVVLFLNIAGVV